MYKRKELNLFCKNIKEDMDQVYSIFQQYPVISIDSRTCPFNALFFALKGDQFDGNDYILHALDKGAFCAVGDRDDLPKHQQIIKVKNVLHTLQSLANYHRKQMSVPVIAITGTNGKTTTKELIATTLSSKYRVLYTKDNLNNQIGVPLTLLRMHSGHQMAVIEMGANHSNEIQRLCQIAEPNCGLITNIGKAHLEGFGSLEEVMKEKMQLYNFLDKNQGTIFVNADNRMLKNRTDSLSAISYGTALDTFVSGKILTSDPTLVLEWYRNNRKNRIKTRLVGNYNFENILAAICVAHYFKVEDDEIGRAIAEYTSTNHRSQNWTTSKNQLIIDSYNANPDSMREALKSFLAMKSLSKMVILGEMKELGKYTQKEHQMLLNNLFLQSTCQVFLVGKHFEDCVLPCSDWKLFSHTEDLVDYLQTESIKGYHVLIKGSRSNRLEKLLPYL